MTPQETELEREETSESQSIAYADADPSHVVDVRDQSEASDACESEEAWRRAAVGMPWWAAERSASPQRRAGRRLLSPVGASGSGRLCTRRNVAEATSESQDWSNDENSSRRRCCAPLHRLRVRLFGSEELLGEGVDEFPEAEQRASEQLEAWLKNNGLEQTTIEDDGNCQFASISDQLYGTPRRHALVREVAVRQLQTDVERYKAYVAERPYEDYLSDMSMLGCWGDHVTLQALADAFGIRVLLATGFGEEGALEILPAQVKSKVVAKLAFEANHYSSLRPRRRAWDLRFRRHVMACAVVGAAIVDGGSASEPLRPVPAG